MAPRGVMTEIQGPSAAKGPKGGLKQQSSHMGPSGHNLKLTLEFLELKMKSKYKKGVKRFF